MDATTIWPYATFAIVPAAAWVVVRASERMEFSWRRSFIRAAATFVRLTSLLILVLSIPSGSIDISDLWLLSVSALVPALLLLATIKSRLIRRAWVRVITRGVSGILFGLAAIVFVLLCAFETACVARPKPIYSPDGRHLALVRVSMQGALGADSASVSLRRSWRPIAVSVWTGILIGAQPEIKWLGNTRLLVRYVHEPGHTVCDAGRTGEVEVVCEDVAGHPRRLR